MISNLQLIFEIVDNVQLIRDEDIVTTVSSHTIHVSPEDPAEEQQESLGDNESLSQIKSESFADHDSLLHLTMVNDKEEDTQDLATTDMREDTQDLILIANKDEQDLAGENTQDLIADIKENDEESTSEMDAPSILFESSFPSFHLSVAECKLNDQTLTPEDAEKKEHLFYFKEDFYQQEVRINDESSLVPSSIESNQQTRRQVIQ